MQAHEFSTPRVREVADPTHGNQTVIATITSTKPSQRGVMLASILAVPDGTSHKPVLNTTPRNFVLVGHETAPQDSSARLLASVCAP